MRLRERTRRVASGSLFVLLLLSANHGETQTATLNFVSIDFRPQSGGYNAEWPGPPRRRLRYEDVKHYVPSFNVQRPPSSIMRVSFWIMEKRSFPWGDPTLGSFSAEFNPAGEITVRYPSSAGTGQAPEGSPPQTVGTIWLGCTEQGRVRGNEGRGDDSYARIYLKMFTVATGGAVSGVRLSSYHDVRCVD